MKAYLDKESGLWKWGANGKPMHTTKQECERFGLDTLTDRLRKIRDSLNKTVSNHGKVS
jgi:hypothetical protein